MDVSPGKVWRGRGNIIFWEPLPFRAEIGSSRCARVDPFVGGFLVVHYCEVDNVWLRNRVWSHGATDRRRGPLAHGFRWSGIETGLGAFEKIRSWFGGIDGTGSMRITLEEGHVDG